MKVGNTIEYYAPESVVGDHFSICKGTVSTILPNDSLQEMTDVHFYIDGLIPITYGQPIWFEGGKWFNSHNCNFIVGDDKGANLFWDSFPILRKGPWKNSLYLISQRKW